MAGETTQIKSAYFISGSSPVQKIEATLNTSEDRITLKDGDGRDIAVTGITLPAFDAYIAKLVEARNDAATEFGVATVTTITTA